MFKPNHYYKVIHRDFAWWNPVKCVIKVISDCDDGMEWEVEILKTSDSVRFHTGQITKWFHHWCFDIEEIKNKSELLAVVL